LQAERARFLKAGSLEESEAETRTQICHAGANQVFLREANRAEQNSFCSAARCLSKEEIAGNPRGLEPRTCRSHSIHQSPPLGSSPLKNNTISLSPSSKMQGLQQGVPLGLGHFGPRGACVTSPRSLTAKGLFLAHRSALARFESSRGTTKKGA